MDFTVFYKLIRVNPYSPELRLLRGQVLHKINGKKTPRQNLGSTIFPLFEEIDHSLGLTTGCTKEIMNNIYVTKCH